MKKLLSWLMTFIIGLSNNVTYVHQEDEHDYIPSEIYYYDPGAAQPDYRDMNARASKSSSSVSCRYSNYSTSRSQTVHYRPDDNPDIVAYWFEPTFKLIQDIPDDSKSFTLETTGYIIAPYDCILSNENLQANDCTSMELICTIHNDEKYRISITGMDMWYCDRYREELVYHTWENPDENGYKHKFSAGDIVGFGKEGVTKIVVNPMKNGSVDNRKLTVQDFFLQR